MNKAVMASIQPYYVFLIIAKYMGWNIPQDKKVEVRKGFPKDKAWNKKVNIYCSKSKKSFNRIPKEYQPLMRPFLGKVIGEFVCDKIDEFREWQLHPYGKFAEYEQENLDNFLKATCLTFAEVCTYRENLPYYNPLYGWQISNLKIYDRPKELGEFWAYNEEWHKRFDEEDGYCCYDATNEYGECLTDCGDNASVKNCYHCWEEWSGWCHRLTRPPQSWCYVEELEE